MATDTQKRAEAESQGEKSNFGRLVFSDEIASQSDNNMLVFTEYKYTRPTYNSTFNPVKTGTEVVLPMPYNLDVPYAANWAMSNLGAWGNFVSNEGSKLFTGQAMNTVLNQSVGSTLLDTWKKSVAGAEAIGTDALTGNKIFENAGLSLGVARNPFMASTFEGIQFREFNFQYKLYPKSKKEADTIEKIVKAFKYGMHPSYQEFGGLKNALFNYPNIYKPAFLKSEHLFEFSYCVIKNINMSYHDQGTPIYINSNGEKYPAFMSIQLSMQEIDIITKETLDNGTGGKTR